MWCRTCTKPMGSESSTTPELQLNRWHRLAVDLRALSVPQAGKYLVRKATKGWRARQGERSAHRQIRALERDIGNVLPAGLTTDAFLQLTFSGPEGFPLFSARRDAVARVLHEQFPEWVARCLDQADRICNNRISILGHEICIQQPPAWHTDHFSGVQWPNESSAGLRGRRMSSGSDIKFVWELSRFHHGVTLGRAFALTKDERFADKFVALFSSWRMENPPGFGPNWTCAMEVAIRATNLLWAGSLLASSKAFGPAIQEAFTKTLIAHGVFIYHHLEYDEQVVGNSLQPVNANHYLSDLAGLVHISLAFPNCRPATEWRNFAIQELFREVRFQVDDQGVHGEYSPGYHRLVLEMVLGCLILLDHRSIPVPLDIREKVLKMLDFIRHYRKPSGGVPLIRDNDSGRFCILGGDELASHDHLLALGAIYYNQPELYTGRLFEDCLWYLGPAAYDWHVHHSRTLPVPAAADEQGERLPASSLTNPLRSTLYKQSGFAVMRQESHHLLAVCCPKGIHGYCGHAHNDFLSFELEAYGRTFLTDCGSYVYTQNAEWRNRFRSTRSHNTLMVDGQEQNRFNSSQLFEIDSHVSPEVHHWISDEKLDILDAAYSIPLPDGTTVTHERRFVFLKDQALWLIWDRVTGTGEHTVETRFHFGEGIEIEVEAVRPRSTLDSPPISYRTVCTPGPNLFLVAPGNAPLASFIENGWLSARYAVKLEVQVLRFAATVTLPYEQWYVLAPVRSEAKQAQCPIEDLDEILRIAGAASAEKIGRR